MNAIDFIDHGRKRDPATAPALDRGILLALFSLMGFGLVQVYSSSFIFAIESRGDGLFFFKRQLIYAAIATAIMFASAHAPWRWIERYGWALWAVAAAGVAGTLVPGFGVRAGGAARWLRMPGDQVFEPAELLKIGLAPLLAAFVAKPPRGALGWLARAAAVALPLVLVLRQPDFGTFAICVAASFSIMFVFGLRYVYVAAAAGPQLRPFGFSSWPFRIAARGSRRF